MTGAPDAPRGGDRAPVAGLLLANAVSSLGNGTTAVALAWFVLETTGSATSMGIAAAAISVGGVLSAVLGGPLVDRLGLKRASVGGDLTSAAAVAAIPLLALSGLLSFPVLVLLVLAMASLNTQGDTARYALMPPLASRAAMTMERANSIDRSIARLSQIVGPLLAGVLIVVIGPITVLFLNAATYLASAAIVWFTVPAAAAGSPSMSAVSPSAAPTLSDATDARPGARRGYLSDLLEGLRFVFGNRLLVSLVFIATLANFLDTPLFSVIMPIYAQSFYGSATSLGLVLSAVAGGALVGTLLFALLRRPIQRRRTFLSCLVVAPLLFYGALTLTPPLAILVGIAMLAGAITGPVNPIMLTVVQSNTPPELAGRAVGALTALAGAGIPIGSLLAGFAVEGIGVIPTIGAMGVMYVALVAAMILNPALRRMDSPPAA